MIYIGMNRLGYTEREVLDMTPRKYFLIYDQMLIVTGVKKDGDEYAIDDIF